MLGVLAVLVVLGVLEAPGTTAELALPGVSAAPGTTAELALPGVLVVLVLLKVLAERADVVVAGNASQILRFHPFPIKPHGKIIGKG